MPFLIFSVINSGVDMASEKALLERCGGKCELCTTERELTIFDLPQSAGQGDCEIMLCNVCQQQYVAHVEELDANHLRCLSDSMWSPVPAVQILAWRMLKRLDAQSWAQDLLEMLYLDASLLAWAEAGVQEESERNSTPTKDSNGVTLKAGDTVTITKDLKVKGTSIVAKQGTAVRGISLTDNPEHIEGRVNGTRIVILTCFVKKS
ncbi:MAG: protein PhnA [Pseudohongiellaceae bacterium]|jgi:protein PhnA